MNKKVAFILIALIGIGLYALPSTTALFSGQHSFVNIDATGNQIDCVKCHGDVQAELGGQTSTTTGSAGPHENFKCEYCHRIEAGSSSGDNAYAAITYSNGVYTRGLLVTVQDYEALEGLPENVTGNQTTISTLEGKYALGPLYNGTVLAVMNPTLNATVLEIAEPSARRLLQTYSPTLGEPLDQDPITRYGGLDLSKAAVVKKVGGHGVTYYANLTGAGSNAVNPGSSYHAASLVSCMECHGGAEPMGHYSRVIDGEQEVATPCDDCHYGGTTATGNRWTELDAGGFGLTIGNALDTGATEAHGEFVRTDDGITRYGGQTNDTGVDLYASNGACVACHTHVKVDITYTKPETYTFAVDMTNAPVEVVDTFSAEGSVVSNSS